MKDELPVNRVNFDRLIEPVPKGKMSGLLDEDSLFELLSYDKEMTFRTKLALLELKDAGVGVRTIENDFVRITLTLPFGGEGIKILVLSKLVIEADTWCAGELKLEKPDGSSIYKLAEASNKNEIITDPNMLKEYLSGKVDIPVYSSFLITHDWAGALSKAEGMEGGDYRIFENRAYEFKISGQRMVMMFVLTNNQEEVLALPFLNFKGIWYLPVLYTANAESTSWACPYNSDMPHFNRVSQFCFEQIKAISIVLEAEVAVSEIVRAPPKLNEARIKKGKLPLNDYHVINLNRQRKRYVPAEGGASDEQRQSPRLHFRRGHYRHYPNYKVWIKWQLVGNPDLGWITKDYKL